MAYWSAWLFALIVSAIIVLPFSAFILFGVRERKNSIATCAMVAMVLLFFSLGVNLLFLICGFILLVAGWVIALDDALSKRRWWSFIFLSVSVLLAVGLYFMRNPVFSSFCPAGTAGASCNANRLITLLVYLVAFLCGPGAILVYALRKEPRPTVATSAQSETAASAPLIAPGDEQ